MKKNKKKLKGFIFIVPTFVALFLMCVLPLLFSLIASKTINNSFFDVFTFILLIIFVVDILFGFLLSVYLMLDVYNRKKFDNNTKIFWYILLFMLNIFIVPYYYYRYMRRIKDFKKKKNIYIIVVAILCLLSILSSAVMMNSYAKAEKIKRDKIIAEKKRREAVRNVYQSKDEKFEMTFKIGHKKFDVSEYDLYVKNESKNLVTGAFLYNIVEFEERDNAAIINKQSEYIKTSRKGVKVYKEMSERTEGNKKIHSLELSGKDEKSGDCIYKLSAISFEGNTENIIYVIQVVLKKDYKKNIKELDEIVNSTTLK